MQPRLLTTALVMALTAAPAMAASQLTLLPPGPGDEVPVTLLARSTAPAPSRVGTLAAPPPMPVEHAPVSVNWPLPHNVAIQPRAQPFARPSHEYWRDVSASELQQGLNLPLTAPGAVIRLSPGSATLGAINPADVHLQLGTQTLDATHASLAVADATQLRAAGMAAPTSTVMLQLKPELGAGLATLRVPTARGRYVVHVYEPASPYAATARADHASLLQGQSLDVHVVLTDNGHALPLESVGGSLRAPDGHSTPLHYRRQADGSYAVTVNPQAIPATPGLWEVHSYTTSHDAKGGEIRRDTTTVFAAAVPDARFSGLANVHRASDAGIDIVLGVTARQASRYAASAVLYGRDASGKLVPAAYAQSAAWLSTGSGSLTLHYAPASLKGVGAPYELHDLRLDDQPALGQLERRAVALRFIAP